MLSEVIDKVRPFKHADEWSMCKLLASHSGIQSIILKSIVLYRSNSLNECHYKLFQQSANIWSFPHISKQVIEDVTSQKIISSAAAN